MDFEKKVGDNYIYPREFRDNEKECSLYGCKGDKNKCAFCPCRKKLITVHHWCLEWSMRKYIAKMVTVQVCKKCLSNRKNDPAFRKEITHVCYEKN